MRISRQAGVVVASIIHGTLAAAADFGALRFTPLRSRPQTADYRYSNLPSWTPRSQQAVGFPGNLITDALPLLPARLWLIQLANSLSLHLSLIFSLSHSHSLSLFTCLSFLFSLSISLNVVFSFLTKPTSWGIDPGSWDFQSNVLPIELIL